MSKREEPRKRSTIFITRGRYRKESHGEKKKGSDGVGGYRVWMAGKKTEGRSTLAQPQATTEWEGESESSRRETAG